MKKSFVLFVTLVVLAVVVVCFSHATILAEKDQVKITENIYYGDKSVVEGATLELKNHYESQIFWNTTYVIGEEPEIKTDYQFYQSEQDYDGGYWLGSIYFNNDIHHNVNWEEESSYELEGLELAFQELYESLGPAESDEKIIFLKDYMDYYEFSVDFQGPYEYGRGKRQMYFDLIESELKNDIAYGEKEGIEESEVDKPRKRLEWLQTFHEFFKIPVLENDVSVISMEKDANGNVSGWGISIANGGGGTGNTDIPEYPHEKGYDTFNFNTMYYVGDGDVYMTFQNRSFNGVIMDTSLIPGGYGIYHFTYEEKKEELHPEELQMVYAIDPNVEVHDLTMDARKENLLLFTSEESDMYMSVIDIETMTLEEKFNISELYENEFYGIEYYVLEEDYMVIVTYGDIIVFTIDDKGNYTMEFQVARKEPFESLELDQDDYYRVLASDTYFDWNGEQLIFANNMYDVNGYTSTDFYVAVVDANGIQYFAVYETSLSSTISRDENGYDMYPYSNCRPVDDEPIVVKWK